LYLLRISFRNLFRRKGRTLIISSILALAVVFFLFMESLMIGLMDITFANITDFETPHVEIGRQEFFQEEEKGNILPLEENFIPDETILAVVEEREGFVAWTGVLDFSGEFIAGRHQYPVRVRAINPDTFPGVFKNEEYLVQGEFIAAGEPGIVIGKQLAEFFDLEVGDYYTLRFQDIDRSFNTMQGEVRGLISVPHPEMNLGTVFVARDQANAALGLDENKISRLMVRLEDRGLAPEQAGQLEEKIGGEALQVRSYREAAEFLVSLEAWGFIETYFILALFLVVGAIGIISAVVLAALERVKEIGMMKAMGLKEREIVGVFLLEAAGMGAVGGLLGCVLGGGIVFWLAEVGMRMEVLLDMEGLGVPMGDMIYGAWNPLSFILIFGFVVVVAVISSLFPSYWAARKDPVEALQYR